MRSSAVKILKQTRRFALACTAAAALAAPAAALAELPAPYQDPPPAHSTTVNRSSVPTTLPHPASHGTYGRIEGPSGPGAPFASAESAVDDGFDFADASIGAAVVAGGAAILLAAAAFLVGRRRRPGALQA